MNQVFILPTTRKRRFDLLRFWNAGTAFDALAITLAGLVVFTIVDTQVGSGDYGQWLMVSRYYAGEDIPGYREISAVPPVVPLLLALTHLVISDPLTSLAVFKAFLALAFFLSVYVAGSTIFTDKAAGLLGAVCAFFVTDRFLELFAFGGLLQLTSLIFICLAVAAFAKASHSERLTMHWWIAGSSAIFLAALSHVGTGVIAILTGVMVAVVAAIANRHLSWPQRAQALVPLGIALLVLAPYWLMVILPENSEYASNAASANYRGPDTLWKRLEAYQPTLILLWAGAGALIAGSVYESLRRKANSYLIVAAWAIAAWGFLGITIIRGVGTEYPRFMYPLLLPLAIAAGGALLHGLKGVIALLPGAPVFAITLAPLAAVSLMLVAAAPGAVESYEREARFYRMSNLEDLVSLSEWMDERLPEGQGVLASVKEGKWVEGLTGREALFMMPNRYSFRPYERERSLAAETLLRSTFAATNGQFFIKYFESVHDIPRYPWIAINHGGEYVDLLRVSPLDSLAFSGGGPLASMGTLSADDVDWVYGEGQLTIKTEHIGERRGQRVNFTQLATLDEKEAAFTLVQQIESKSVIDEMQTKIRPVPGVMPTLISARGNEADFFFPRMGNAQPYIHLTIPDGAGVFEPADDGVLLRVFNTNRLEVRFSFDATAERINNPAVIPPIQLLEDYNVGAAVLLQGPALEQRIARLEALGFTVERTAGPYVAMVRQPLVNPEAALQPGTQP